MCWYLKEEENNAEYSDFVFAIKFLDEEKRRDLATFLLERIEFYPEADGEWLNRVAEY